MKRFCIWFDGKIRKAIKCKFIRITCEILVEIYFSIINAIEGNLRNVSTILRTLLPYLMWYIGADLYRQRGKFAVGGEIFIPVIIFMITYYIRQYANRIGKGEKIPIPERRFTEEGEEPGEYTVETQRIEELILYMTDLEDWLERKGLMRKKK